MVGVDLKVIFLLDGCKKGPDFLVANSKYPAAFLTNQVVVHPVDHLFVND